MCGPKSARAPILPDGLQEFRFIGYDLLEVGSEVTQTEVRWLRVAFGHLGKLDTITVLEQMLDRTRDPTAPITSSPSS